MPPLARCFLALVPALLLAFVPTAHATDGTVLISQATALHGLPGCNSTGLPIVICSPGSYRLSGNLAASGTDAIDITADGVTLDLNGFTILQSSLGGVGIDSSSNNGITVLNGTIEGFQGGIVLDGAGETVSGVRVLNSTVVNIQIGDGTVTASSALGGGIGVRIVNGTVSDSTIENGTRDGIEFSSAGQATGNLLNNSGACIRTDNGPVNVSGNIFESNCMLGISFGVTGYYSGNVFYNVSRITDGGTNAGTNAIYNSTPATPPGWDITQNQNQ